MKILKGWIPQVFSSIDSNEKYCFVHLDVDLYQPTIDSLSYFYDNVISGEYIQWMDSITLNEGSLILTTTYQ